ncbi:MAG: hypothetical protein ACLPWF_14130 [Bryobacteraceae bacterium]
MRFLSVGLSFGVLAAGSLWAQAVISTHSGVVQYVEGHAFLADKPVEPKFGQFPDIKENQEFRTEDGRAEILLTPGVFLRIGENSSIRMLSTRLTDTRVEVLSGSAIIESNEMPKDNGIELVYKKESMRLVKQGLYRVDTEPAHFQVYEGEAVVTDASGQLTLRSGKQTNLAGVLMAENFDRKPDDQDALYRWSDRRASYVAQANVVAATAAGSSSGSYGSGYGGYGAYDLAGLGGGYGGLGYGGLGYGALGYGGLGYGGLGFGGFGYNPAFLGGWAFNPIFGMYTYLPYSGFGYSPFGYTYYSPNTAVYAPYYGGSGYTYGGRGASGESPTGRLAAASRFGSVVSHRGASSGLTASARSFGGGHAASFSGGGHASFGGGGHSGGGHR